MLTPHCLKISGSQSGKTFGNLWRQFLVVTTARKGGFASGIRWVETEDTAKHLTMGRTALNYNHRALSVNSNVVAEVEKPWSKQEFKIKTHLHV